MSKSKEGVLIKDVCMKCNSPITVRANRKTGDKRKCWKCRGWKTKKKAGVMKSKPKEVKLQGV